jgi:RimJ/RimL family protein N-acetyltransferase
MDLADGVVTLGPPQDADAQLVAAAVQASLSTLRLWMPWATSDYSASHALEWMSDARAAGRHSFVIRDPGGTGVGTCGLQQADVPNRCIQLGYWIAAPYEGRGYATRAARLVIDHAFTALEFHRVEILISVRNHPSQRVAQRLDARLEATLMDRLHVRGEWHDALLYAVLA